MYNKNFYPTPSALADKMTKGIDFKNAYVLEPSAGKGDLAAALPYGVAKVHLIESDLALCEILAASCQSYGKKHWQIVANDFLSFSPAYQYDAIIMNPPFDAGAAHFLHAWNIADGAHIRCLLNAETLRNPYTAERELIAAIIAKNGGEVEYIQNAFATAERRTGVEVVLVSIFKPAKKRLVLDIGNLRARGYEDVAQGKEATELATPSYIKNQVASYDNAVAALRDVVAAMHAFNYYAAGCGAKQSYYNGYCRLTEALIKGTSESFNDAVNLLTQKAWEDFFNKPSYQKLITNGVKEQFAAEQKRLGGMAFNEANLNAFLDTLIGTRGHVMKKAVEDSFDWLTSYDKKNTMHKEGWKTNSHFKVNKKCIVPALHKIGNTGTEINYWAKDNYEGKFRDLELALCYILGEKHEDMRGQGICAVLYKVINAAHSYIKKSLDYVCPYTVQHETKFFFVRIYKKGTMHLTFKDEGVWARFNQAAAEGKNWIG